MRRGDRFKWAWFLASVAALLVVVPAVLTAAKVTDWRWVIAGLIAAAVAGVFAGPFQDRFNRLMQLREEQAQALRTGSLALDGRPPRVREMPNPMALGVHPGPMLRREGDVTRVSVYVPRDIDAELRARLTCSGFVLLVGDSAAGKSRAAYEAVASCLPDHLLIAPAGRDGLAAALEQAAGSKRCVLWLDDLEAFLGAGGLTRNAIAGLLAGDGHHRAVLATMRATEEDRHTGGDTSDGNDREPFTEARAVLAQAHRILVNRRFSPDERDRAAEFADKDPRLADALFHADVYGIAEYLAGGPQLLAEWENAWSKGHHPRGAALVKAAVECRRAGYADPLPRDLLEAVHSYYLDQEGGSRLHPEPLDDAWRWALRLRPVGNALLHQTEDGAYEVFDYLIDHTQHHGPPDVPEHILRTALTHASTADIDNIAITAYRQGRYGLAVHADRKSLTIRIDALGPDHIDTLSMRNALAHTLGTRLGRWEEAAAEYRAIVDADVRTLGPDNIGTMDDHSKLLLALTEAGRWEEAAAECRTLADAAIRVLGPDDPRTFETRIRLVNLLTRLGRGEEAQAEYDACLKSSGRAWGPNFPIHLGHSKIGRCGRGW